MIVNAMGWQRGERRTGKWDYRLADGKVRRRRRPGCDNEVVFDCISNTAVVVVVLLEQYQVTALSEKKRKHIRFNQLNLLLLVLLSNCHRQVHVAKHVLGSHRLRCILQNELRQPGWVAVPVDDPDTKWLFAHSCHLTNRYCSAQG